jgi:hypothetical protein
MMRKIAIAVPTALVLITQIANAQAPASDKPQPDKPPASPFSLQPIAPLRDGSNYWPGYLLTYAGDKVGQIEACYIIARSADLGGGTLVGTIPPGKQVVLLCSDPVKLPNSP